MILQSVYESCHYIVNRHEFFSMPPRLVVCYRRCCTTMILADSHCESMRLDRPHEQAITRPLPHDELVQLQRFASQARVAADLAGQGHDVARAA